MKVNYSSNNSGGGWWLKDKDWIKLEEAGWYVVWGGLEFCYSNYEPKNEPVCDSDESCPGHRKFESYRDMTKKDKYMGDTLATEAHKEFDSVADAIREFEKITKQEASDEGCNCCGPPHSFSTGEGEGREYYSGEEVLQVLYPGSPTSLREAIEGPKKRKRK